MGKRIGITFVEIKIIFHSMNNTKIIKQFISEKLNIFTSFLVTRI